MPVWFHNACLAIDDIPLEACIMGVLGMVLILTLWYVDVIKGD